MILMVLCISTAVASAGGNGLADKVRWFEDRGHTCTAVYNAYHDDEGFAAFKAVKTGKLLFNVATGQGTSECSNFEYLARPAFGYVKYTHRGGVGSFTSWHIAEATWTDKFGSFSNSVKSVEVRGKLVTDDGIYQSLTDWVTDKP